MQDLSLLTNLSLSDIEHLQSVGKEAQAARQSFILKDDQDSVWNHIQKVRDGRVDFILDNCEYSILHSRPGLTISLVQLVMRYFPDHVDLNGYLNAA